jgi:periplasmic protein TonB
MTMPIYPAKALRDRVRGVVILRVLVSETGEPMEVVVETGAHKDLNDAAIEAARHWRFEPAKKDGYPVRTYTTVRFPFEGVQFARTPLSFAVTPSR